VLGLRPGLRGRPRVRGRGGAWPVRGKVGVAHPETHPREDALEVGARADKCNY